MATVAIETCTGTIEDTRTDGHAQNAHVLMLFIAKYTTTIDGAKRSP